MANPHDNFDSIDSYKQQFSQLQEDIKGGNLQNMNECAAMVTEIEGLFTEIAAKDKVIDNDSATASKKTAIGTTVTTVPAHDYQDYTNLIQSLDMDIKKLRMAIHG